MSRYTKGRCFTYSVTPYIVLYWDNCWNHWIPLRSQAEAIAHYSRLLGFCWFKMQFDFKKWLSKRDVICLHIIMSHPNLLLCYLKSWFLPICLQCKFKPGSSKLLGTCLIWIFLMSFVYWQSPSVDTVMLVGKCPLQYSLFCLGNTSINYTGKHFLPQTRLK